MSITSELDDEQATEYAAWQQRIDDIAAIRKALRGRAWPITLDPRQRGRVQPLTAADAAALIHVCADWMETCRRADAPRVAAEHNVRVAIAYSESDAPIPSDASRQGTLFASTVLGARALSGNKKALKAYTRAVVKAMTAVTPPVPPAQLDLVLRIDSMLRARRPDLPARLCALIACNVASAIDPAYGPRDDDDQTMAMRAVDSRRHRAAKAAKALARTADQEWVHYMEPAAQTYAIWALIP